MMSCWTLGSMAIFALFLLCLGTCTAKKFSAVFIFGDSVVDAGNNNYIPTLAKANFKPVGIDFGRPTGRFSNGRIVTDIIGQSLGFKNFTPPYLAPTTRGPVILQGVNYASGAGGILNATGADYYGRIPMDVQLRNFENTKHDIISSIGAPAAHKLITKAIFSVIMGSNDFINNYFLPDVSHHTKKVPLPKTFIGKVISAFRRQLTKLYDMGARKIVVSNVPPIGCCPRERDVHPALGAIHCVAYQNIIIQQYNHRLKGLLMELTNKLKGSMFVYADVYHILDDIIHNYKSYGFETASVSCCGRLGLHHGIITCVPNSTVCADRTKHVFWDAYHVTESSNLIIAKRVIDGDSKDVSPMNIRALSEI